MSLTLFRVPFTAVQLANRSLCSAPKPSENGTLGDVQPTLEWIEQNVMKMNKDDSIKEKLRKLEIFAKKFIGPVSPSADHVSADMKHELLNDMTAALPLILKLRSDIIDVWESKGIKLRQLAESPNEQEANGAALLLKMGLRQEIVRLGEEGIPFKKNKQFGHILHGLYQWHNCAANCIVHDELSPVVSIVKRATDSLKQ